MHASGMTYHPQTEALLQCFEPKTTSTAINSSFSYPNTRVLTKGGDGVWGVGVSVMD